jgi:hypothetical protein
MSKKVKSLNKKTDDVEDIDSLEEDQNDLKMDDISRKSRMLHDSVKRGEISDDVFNKEIAHLKASIPSLNPDEIDDLQSRLNAIMDEDFIRATHSELEEMDKHLNAEIQKKARELGYDKWNHHEYTILIVGNGLSSHYRRVLKSSIRDLLRRCPVGESVDGVVVMKKDRLRKA